MAKRKLIALNLTEENHALLAKIQNHMEKDLMIQLNKTKVLQRLINLYAKENNIF
jgi:hypothetical protein|tara:strand:+ start:444 stop:608 length:165 start_codon:yes stop_codon:yes gene_type:complete